MVIGATGHIGSYLVPRLVRAGHEVMAVSRGERKPYHEAVEWRSVQSVEADRAAEDVAGSFGQRIAALRPDAVVDPRSVGRREPAVNFPELIRSLIFAIAWSVARPTLIGQP